jgi:hypothetical protein
MLALQVHGSCNLSFSFGDNSSGRDAWLFEGQVAVTAGRSLSACIELVWRSALSCPTSSAQEKHDESSEENHDTSEKKHNSSFIELDLCPRAPTSTAPIIGGSGPTGGAELQLQHRQNWHRIGR